MCPTATFSAGLACSDCGPLSQLAADAGVDGAVLPMLAAHCKPTSERLVLLCPAPPASRGAVGGSAAPPLRPDGANVHSAHLCAYFSLYVGVRQWQWSGSWPAAAGPVCLLAPFRRRRPPARGPGTRGNRSFAFQLNSCLSPRGPPAAVAARPIGGRGGLTSSDRGMT